MLPTASNVTGYSANEIDQARSSYPGKLSRLLSIFRPTWHVSHLTQKPRRSIDRELQEHWPIDYLM